MVIKKKLLWALTNIINRLNLLAARLSKTPLPELPYVPLSASDNAENVEDYLTAIDWAIENREKYGILNIALTGPYGSGKSSILKTYIATRKGKGNHFLPISLATFREEKVTVVNGNVTAEKNDMLRLIELSILQQIFYHEDDHRIPDSRFRKIKSFSTVQLFLITVCILFFLVAAWQLFLPGTVLQVLKLDKNFVFPEALYWVCVGILSLGLSFVIFRSIRLISSLSIEKLKIHNAEINIDKNISKSILNHHLDEILYFFEVTDYDIVIIEDLDRFRETDIFTKLREINLLINNSEKIKRKIVFLYAVRDDMFREDNERTKFFEFIIPVIPIINPNNSSQKLLAKSSTENYKLSENLIDSISSFIDDMRLLHNITNEFYLYRQKVNSSLKPDNLLALIVYKNLFPNDFAQLNNNKGDLFKIFNETKRSLIEQQTKTINQSNEKIKQRIGELELVTLTDLSELRYIYLLHYLDKLPGFVNFVVNGSKVSLTNMVKDANFQRLMKDEFDYTYYLENQYQYSRTVKVPLKFKQIEDEVNPTRKYLDREEDIRDVNVSRNEELKNAISENDKKISALRKLKLRELVIETKHLVQFENEKQSGLVNLLIRNGFIDENYNDYISLFYEGSITKSDYQFLVNIKTAIDTLYDYPLSKVKNIIRKINLYDFETTHVFNYHILDSLLTVKAFSDKLDVLITTLANESTASVRFIDGYIDNGKDPGMLIRQLLIKWPGLWNYLENKSQYTIEKKKQYFKLIIKHADFSHLKTIYANEGFNKALYSYSDFLSIIDDKDRIKAVIKLLDLKFVQLDETSSPKELLEFIYEGNYYDINPYMLTLLLKVKNLYEELGFTTRNYHFIRNSKATELINYIQENLSSYISRVYVQLQENTEDVEADLLILLNQPSLKQEDLSAILEQTSTKITDLSTIKSPETQLLVIENNKMLANWNNLIHFYETTGSDSVESLATFINYEENAIALSKQKIPRDQGEYRKYRDYIIKLLLCNEIDGEAYNRVLMSVPYTFNSLNLDDLDDDKVRSLVEQRTLGFTKINYDKLKEYGDYYIRFLEVNKNQFLKDPKVFEIDSDDLNEVLRSTVITDAEKNILIEKIDEALLIAKTRSVEEVGKMILRNNAYRVSDSLINAVLVNQNLSNEQRIRIFKWKNRQVDEGHISAFLNGLKDPYSDITIKGKRPLLTLSEYNSELAEVLKSRNYISSFDIKENGIRINTFNS